MNMRHSGLLIGSILALAGTPGLAEDNLQVPNPVGIVKRLFSDIQSVGSTLGSALQPQPGQGQPDGSRASEAPVTTPAAPAAATVRPEDRASSDAQLRAELEAMKAKVEALARQVGQQQPPSATAASAVAGTGTTSAAAAQAEAARTEQETRAKAEEAQRLVAKEQEAAAGRREAEAAARQQAQAKATEAAARRQQEEEKAAAAAAARQEAARSKSMPTVSAASLPARPKTPLDISEAVWSQIEASEFYRNLPRQKAVRVVTEGTTEIERTATQDSNAAKTTTSSNRTITEITPVSDRCGLKLSEQVLNGNRSLSESFACAGLSLGTVSGGRPTSRLERIEVLDGSLFPLRVGNRQVLITHTVTLAANPSEARQSSDCEVMGRMPARQVDSRLAGTAWKLHCKSGYASRQVNMTWEADDYYLEDPGTLLSAIGRLDRTRNTWFLPKAGSKTVYTPEGPNASRSTTTYASHDWTVGTEVVATLTPSPLAPPPPAWTQKPPVDPVKEEQERAARVARQAELERLQQLQQEQAARQAAAQQQAAQQAAQQQAAAARPGFGGGLLGGLASRLVDRNVAMVNSAMAGTGVVGSTYANLNSQLGAQTKEQIARETASTDEARPGHSIASALSSGGGAGAFGSGALSGGSDAFGSSAASGGGNPSASQAASKDSPALKACLSVVYPGDKSDVQVSGFDRIAQFDACAYKATGDERYVADGNNQCKVLAGLLASTRGNFRPLFCSGSLLKR
jgi:hypothetical protein